MKSKKMQIPKNKKTSSNSMQKIFTRVNKLLDKIK